MFAVVFEVRPKAARWDEYFALARTLRPELEGIEGFVDNVRYRSLTREGWLLSLSAWRDEKAVVRWRTRARHQQAQEVGRSEILAEYHLRVGQITRDTQPSATHVLRQHRPDMTEVGEGPEIVLVDARRPAEWVAGAGAKEVARWLGLQPDAAGLVAWDVLEAVLTPGDVVLLLSWRDAAAADAFESLAEADEKRMRRVRVVRDYGMFDRREAPQYFPDAAGGPTLHG